MRANMLKIVQTVIGGAIRHGTSKRGAYAAYFLLDTLQVTHLGHVIFEMRNTSARNIKDVRVSTKGTLELRAVNTCLAMLNMKERVIK